MLLNTPQHTGRPHINTEVATTVVPTRRSPCPDCRDQVSANSTLKDNPGFWLVWEIRERGHIQASSWYRQEASSPLSPFLPHPQGEEAACSHQHPCGEGDWVSAGLMSHMATVGTWAPRWPCRESQTLQATLKMAGDAKHGSDPAEINSSHGLLRPSWLTLLLLRPS